MKCFNRYFRHLLMLLPLVVISTLQAFAQNTETITGTVSDASGATIPGVNIVIKGTSTYAISDDSGKYSINAKEGDVLVFSFIGYATLEITVGQRNIIDAVLQSDDYMLDDVVVVAYGQQKKTTMTGSISSLSGKELIKAPSTNVSSLLGGRVAGVSSVQESGQPGADQANLIIRGSRYGVTYIVDGFPRSINDLDPNDIASVSVLKDASAAALYGMTSAGGVIIITTKKGNEGKNVINYTGNFGISRNANFPEFLNAEEFAWYYNKASEMDGYDPVFTQEQIALMLNGDDSDGWGNTNWIDLVFGTGFNQKHTVSAQGGTDKYRYYVSLGYLGQEGNIDKYSYDRYNIRANVESYIGKNLKLNFSIAGQAGFTKSPGFASGGSEAEASSWMSIARQTIAAHPYLPTTYDGLPVATVNKYGQGVSPLAAIYDSGYNNNDTYGLQSNISLEWNIPFVKGLSLKVDGSFDHSYTTSKILATPYYVMLASLPDGTTDLNYTKTLDVRNTSYNTLGEGLSRGNQLIGNASINYVGSFAEVHNLEVMLMTEIRHTKSNGFSAYGKELPFIELPELGFANPADSPIGGWSNASRALGFIGRLRYNFAEKYLIELTGRYDGSYKFAGNVEGKRWGFFPAVSAGWRISNEDFMSGVEVIDNLKIRASFGELGSDNVGAYSFLNQYASGSIVYLNGNRYNTLYTSGIANLNLTWERIRSYNVGVDLDMWGGLFGLEADYFYNYNYDILMYRGSSYPPSMGGYYPTVENYGALDTKGFEVVLKHFNTVGSGKNALSYNINLNITYATSRWLKYPDSPNVPDYQCLTGKELGSMLGWVADGLYQTEEEIDNSPWPFGQRPRCGDIKYVDLNGDGVVGYEDKAFIGRTNRPKLTAGLNFGLNWRGLDLSMLFTAGALFDISLTGTYYNGNDDNTIFTETFKEGGNSPLYLVENAWRPDNPNGIYPRLTMNSPTNNNGLASSFWFRDGKYIRLKTVQLGYSIPASIIKYIGASELRIFVEGSNLFTISGLPKGIDPESPGVNNGYYPQQTTYMAGISLTF